MKWLPVRWGMLAIMICGGVVTIFWPTGQTEPSPRSGVAVTAKERSVEPALQPIPAPAATEDQGGQDDAETTASPYALPPVSRALADTPPTESGGVYQPQRVPPASTGERALDTSRLALASAPVSDAISEPAPADPRAAPVRAAISSLDTSVTFDTRDATSQDFATDSLREDFEPPPASALSDASSEARLLAGPRPVNPAWQEPAAPAAVEGGVAFSESPPVDPLGAAPGVPVPAQDLASAPLPATEGVFHTPAGEPVLAADANQPLEEQPLPPARPAGADTRSRPWQSGVPLERSAIAEEKPRAAFAEATSITGTAELQEPLSAPRAASVAAVQSIVEADLQVTASRPGNRTLEGEQAPSLIIDKWAPTEITVGEPAFFQIRVRNAGIVAAHGVRVVDQVPEKTQLDLSRTKPAPQRSTQGLLIWELGTLQPGEEQTVSLSLVATEEGEIGSVAQVIFHAQASVRTIATRADLQIQLTPLGGPMLVGDQATMSMTVTNRGSGLARDVMVEVDLPDALSHPAGNELENALGDLRPGESASMELAVEAAQGGARQAIAIAVRSQSQTMVQEEIPVEVRAPQLRVEAEGPKRRYLERAATMSLSVTNPGTAAARNIRVVAALPEGLEFAQADESGQYLRDENVVVWQIDTIAAGGEALLSLTMVPVTPGDQVLRLTAEGDLASRATSQRILQVKRRAELLFTVKDLEDPIEVGSETAYLIEVHNTGTKPEASIRVSALLPPGMEYLGSQGPRPATVTDTSEGQQVGFGTVPSLAAQETVVFRIRVRGRQAGGQVMRVQLSSDQVQRVAVRKEESTEVYLDQ